MKKSIFICENKKCNRIYRDITLPKKTWWFPCEDCDGMAIKKGYSIKGRKGENIIGLAHARRENIKVSEIAYQQAANYRREHPDEFETISINPIGKQQSQFGQGPLQVPKKAVESIKQKVQEAWGGEIEEMVKDMNTPKISNK